MKLASSTMKSVLFIIAVMTMAVKSGGVSSSSSPPPSMSFFTDANSSSPYYKEKEGSYIMALEESEGGNFTCDLKSIDDAPNDPYSEPTFTLDCTFHGPFIGYIQINLKYPDDDGEEVPVDMRFTSRDDDVYKTFIQNQKPSCRTAMKKVQQNCDEKLEKLESYCYKAQLEQFTTNKKENESSLKSHILDEETAKYVANEFEYSSYIIEKQQNEIGNLQVANKEFQDQIKERDNIILMFEREFIFNEYNQDEYDNGPTKSSSKFFLLLEEHLHKKSKQDDSSQE